MLSRLWALYDAYANPPPVNMCDVHALITSIERLDRDIQDVQSEQRRTSNLYQFAVMEYQIEELLRRRTALSRKKAALLARARRQGPNVDSSLYDKLM